VEGEALQEDVGPGEVEETVPVAGRDIRIVRPRNSEQLLDEDAFEHDEFLPYWAELWPSSRALARAVLARTLRREATLELGCGLGLVSVAAALAGGRVLASDWSPESIAFTRRNAERNDVTVDTLVCSWAQPEPLVARGPWRLVLASDVLYERRNVDQLLALLPRLVSSGEVWIADPGRAIADIFLSEAAADWTIESLRDSQQPATVHRLRRRRA
jgi:predicted nicotinamide N-methyase